MGKAYYQHQVHMYRATVIMYSQKEVGFPLHTGVESEHGNGNTGITPKQVKSSSSTSKKIHMNSITLQVTRLTRQESGDSGIRCARGEHKQTIRLNPS